MHIMSYKHKVINKTKEFLPTDKFIKRLQNLSRGSISKFSVGGMPKEVLSSNVQELGVFPNIIVFFIDFY